MEVVCLFGLIFVTWRMEGISEYLETRIEDKFYEYS